MSPSEYEPVREESERGERSFHVIRVGELTDRQRDILNDIKLALEEDGREQLIQLKHVERRKLIIIIVNMTIN